MIEWIDLWYETSLGWRFITGTFIGGIILSWIGGLMEEDATTRTGEGIGIGMMVTGFILLVACGVGLLGPMVLRLFIWILTGA